MGGNLLRPDAGTTFNDITSSSADFNFLQGQFGAGSPRFSIGLTSGATSGEIHVYWGTGPAFTDTPAAGWQNTGNLLASPDNRFDTTQFSGGAFYDSGAHSYSTYGTYSVDYVSLDLDAGWAVPGGVQQMDVRNFTVNAAVMPVPEPATMSAVGIVVLGFFHRKRAKAA